MPVNLANSMLGRLLNRGLPSSLQGNATRGFQRFNEESRQQNPILTFDRPRRRKSFAEQNLGKVTHDEVAAMAAALVPNVAERPGQGEGGGHSPGGKPGLGLSNLDEILTSNRMNVAGFGNEGFAEADQEGGGPNKRRKATRG